MNPVRLRDLMVWTFDRNLLSVNVSKLTSWFMGLWVLCSKWRDKAVFCLNVTT